VNLGGLDLNLLVTLDALLDERNVTRAGQRVHLSQPAASAALAKLRRHFGDELLVRVGRDYQLTPLAQTLQPLVIDALTHIERAFAVRADFDATASDRRFSVSASDYAATVINAPLRQQVNAEAPGVIVEFQPMITHFAIEELLRRDLLIAPVGYGFNGPHDVVFRDHFVCIVDASNPALKRIDDGESDVVELLAALPHAVGRFADVVTPADRLIEQLGIDRRVAATVGGLLTLPLLVLGTDLVALAPRRLARRYEASGGLRTLEVPGAAGLPLIEAVYWHPSRTSDAALQWLRTAMVRSCALLPSE